MSVTTRNQGERSTFPVHSARSTLLGLRSVAARFPLAELLRRAR
ncbi:hypothetical protein [Curtobacterium sp. 260]|nr:hypothetical protein [Curtobacterium sp. 260]MDP9735983.1 hypothetical protein [Curtobacterium sp. 260]